MNISVDSDAPTALPGNNSGTPVIQNLGPGNIFFDADPDVTSSTGVKIESGQSYEFPRSLGLGGGKIYLIADQDGTDVRYIGV